MPATSRPRSANYARNKGARAERELVDQLRALGLEVERAYGAGRPDDIGDIEGVQPFALQAKNYSDIPRAVREGLDGAATQAARLGPGAIPAAAIRRPAGRWFVAIDLPTFARILRLVRTAS